MFKWTTYRLVTLPLLLLVLLIGGAFGATYKGKSLDGKKYVCTAKGNGVVIGGSVMFDGKTVHLYTVRNVMTLKLASETIDDLKDIIATSDEHGDCTISITDEP